MIQSNKSVTFKDITINYYDVYFYNSDSKNLIYQFRFYNKKPTEKEISNLVKQISKECYYEVKQNKVIKTVDIATLLKL